MVVPVAAQISKFHPCLPTARLSLPTRAFGTWPPLTPLPLVTSIQPQYFHAITHSFAQRQSAIPPSINSFRTLPVTTGVYPLSVPDDRPSGLQACQLFCLDRLGASLSSLCALFCTRFLCFQSLAASFPETPEVGVSVKSPGSSVATWTRRAHPIIIAVSSRVQVHG
jgi:hypothetical protein